MGRWGEGERERERENKDKNWCAPLDLLVVVHVYLFLEKWFATPLHQSILDYFLYVPPSSRLLHTSSPFPSSLPTLLRVHGTCGVAVVRYR